MKLFYVRVVCDGYVLAEDEAAALARSDEIVKWETKKVTAEPYAGQCPDWKASAYVYHAGLHDITLRGAKKLAGIGG